MAEHTDDPIVIIGAGPAGMGLAALLVHEGLRVLVIEKEDHISREWRASTFHPPTLEGFAPLGITETMIKEGLVADRYQIRDRKLGLVAEFDYSAIKDDTEFPFRLQLEQYKFAEIAAEYLEASLLGELRLGTELLSIDDHGDSPMVTVRSSGGVEQIRASFVVGADGARSATRKLLGVGYEGWTYDQQFLLISTDLPFDEYIEDLCYVNYVADPDEFVMLLRIPDVWRVLVPVAPGADAEQVTSESNMRRVLEGVIGRSLRDRPARILAKQLYNVHQRVAERLHGRRTALVGDAAHVNSPMGGFGLNSGLHDSFDLAARLKRLAEAGYPEKQTESELQSYSDSRRSVALEHVRRMSHGNTQMLMQIDEAERQKDRARLAGIAADPASTRDFLLDATMINAVREVGFGRLAS